MMLDVELLVFIPFATTILNIYSCLANWSPEHVQLVIVVACSL